MQRIDAALIAYAAVAKLPEAEERQKNNIQTWLKIHNPLAFAEQQYINQSDDLVTLLQTDKDAVYRFIQSHEDIISTSLHPPLDPIKRKKKKLIPQKADV